MEHGGCVQRERDEQQEIIHVVILAKTLSPQENRVNHAQTVNRHGEQKEMTVSEPRHVDRLNAETNGQAAILESHSLDLQIVFIVKPDPEPKKSFGNLSRQSAMMQTDAHRPGLAKLLELQRRMPRVCLRPAIVAQIGNLPCCRMEFGRALTFREAGGLPIRDTADHQSALRRRC